jgi:hypothetical protein
MHNNNYNQNLTLLNNNYITNDNLSKIGIKLVIIFVSFLVIVLTSLGNLLVLCSWFINKKLQTTNNLFLISLAIADAIIGFVSMPIYTLYIIS